MIARCVADGRALVTLDLDFSNPLVYAPSQHAGVAVLRLPRSATRADLDSAVATFIGAFRSQSLEQQLWIVEIGPVRVYSPPV